MPRPLTPAQIAAYEAVQQYGGIRAACRALGETYSSFHARYTAAVSKMGPDPATQAAMDAVGTTITPSTFWAKTGKNGEVTYSVLVSPGKVLDAGELWGVIEDALSGIEPLPPVDAPVSVQGDLCNVIPIADLHMGGEYGRPEYERECNATLDRVIGALPNAAKTFVVDLGDTTDANDHLGVTPGGKNPVDVVRHDMQATIWAATRFLKHATYRALEISLEVEVHILRGNHSETSHLAVLIGLQEHFRDNPRVKIVVPDDADKIRLITWGQCGGLIDHGDRMKWSQLRDAWTTLEADHWAACKAYRGIYTAHHHKDRSEDLAGVEARQFRSMSAPSHWAKTRFAPMPRGTSAITWHRTEGFEGMVFKKLRPIE